MRVIDHKRVQEKQKKQRSKKPLLVFAAIFAFGLGALSLKSQWEPQENQSVEIAKADTQNIRPKAKKGILKSFTGEQFKNLYNGFAYPNTAPINETTPITGDLPADTRIRQIALQRGYQLRSAPVSDTFRDVGKGYKLQQRAAKPWLDMQTAARKDNIQLGLTAAYRSSDEQKDIFIKRLSQLGIPVGGIAAGYYDPQISQVLRMTAIPGYSRHHTGYTVDISCENAAAVRFEFSPCFEWLNRNNYENAKKAGWIPSYPEGTANQGPDPESWEYVWVGTDAVTE